MCEDNEWDENKKKKKGDIDCGSKFNLGPSCCFV